MVDLARLRGSTVREYLLPPLNVKDAARLLHAAGATSAGAKSDIGTDDRQLLDAARQVAGHALSLQLLGSYLKHAHGGDVLQRDRIDWTRAIGTEQEGHAFRVMQAYERWFEQHGEQGRCELAALRLLGLFDRPASRGCLDALRQPPIAGLTDELAQLDEPAWRATLKRLEEHRLLKLVQRGGDLLEVDAHPLVREYFATQLIGTRSVSEGAGDLIQARSASEGADGVDDGTSPDSSLARRVSMAWRAGHGRLFDYLCESVKEDQPDTLQQLQPLYQAVAHGCLAGRQQEACDKVYSQRIHRGDDHYAPNKLGAFGSELGAIASFFEQPWSRVSPAIREADQAWLLSEAAFTLRALGRLTEALEPMRAGLKGYVAQDDWRPAAITASNLSELELALGLVSEAVQDAEQSVAYADRRKDDFERQLFTRTTWADALHQSGRRSDALALFREAELLQAKWKPKYPMLYLRLGFRYCDLLLADTERAAMKAHAEAQRRRDAEKTSSPPREILDACRDVEQRAAKMFEWHLPGDSLLDIALNHLILSRASLYGALLAESSIANQNSKIENPLASAVDGLRRAGRQDILPLGLLTRAWQRALCDDPAGAQADLDEAWEIAERGPMPLFLADVLMYRARLFGRTNDKGKSTNDKGRRTKEAGEKYPWKSPQEDLLAARELIEQHGYHRRDEELADCWPLFFA